MDRTLSLLAGAGLGAGLMYILDPQMGRRRRAMVRDKGAWAAHEACAAADTVARDMRNRAQGLASGDLSVLAGGKRALAQPWAGRWSPSARTLMTLLGGGLFLYGMTKEFPSACVIGSAGLGLLLEAGCNCSLDDFAQLPRTVREMAGELPGNWGGGSAQSELRQTATVGG